MINKESKGMRREYVRPAMVGEMFTANEYCSSCGESGTVYHFTCDAGYIEKKHTEGFCGCGKTHSSLFGGIPSGYYIGKGKWYVTDANGKSLMKGYDSYSPCGSVHEAESDSPFTVGYMDNLATSEKEAIKVMTWAGPKNNNIHCTTELDINKWETAKS